MDPLGEIPPAMLHALKNGRCTPFVGAGMSCAVGMPSGEQLAQDLAKQIERYSGPMFLPDVAQAYEELLGREPLLVALRQRLEHHARPTIRWPHRALACLARQGLVSTIFTTNFDDCIERTFEDMDIDKHVVVRDKALGERPSPKSCLIVKLHGDLQQSDTLLVTRRDYTKPLSADQSRIYDMLHLQLASSSLMYLGSSLSDPDIQAIQARVNRALGGDTRLSFAVRLPDSQMTTSQWQAHSDSWLREGVKLLPMGLDSFFTRLIGQLPVTLRILHIAFDYSGLSLADSYGGIRTFVEALKNSSTHEHHLLPPKQTGANLRVESYPVRFSKMKEETDQMVEQLSNRFLNKQKDWDSGCPSPDVIHAHFFYPAYQLQQRGFRVAFTSHSLLHRDLEYGVKVLSESAADLGALNIAMEDLKKSEECEHVEIRDIRHVSTISAAHTKDLRDHGVENIHVFRAPTNLRPFLADGASPSAARSQHGLPERLTVGFISRPAYRKGLHLLVQALGSEKCRESNIQLLIVGCPFTIDQTRACISFPDCEAATCAISLPECLAGQVQRLPREGTSELTGTDLVRAFKACDVIVVPSLYEPFGYVALEAMAARRAVLASNIDGLPEIVENDVTGLLFNPAMEGDLATQLHRLLTDPELRNRLADAGCSAADRLWCQKSSVQEFDAWYRQIAFALQVPQPSEIEAIYQYELAGLAASPSIEQCVEIGQRIVKKISHRHHESGFHFGRDNTLCFYVAGRVLRVAGTGAKLNEQELARRIQDGLY